MNTHLKAANFIANLMDRQFKIFNFRFGLDPILGLIPGAGDIISVLISFYIVWIGLQMNLPKEKVWQMIGNVLMDFVVGAVPLVGDLGDFIIKANTKNLEIIKESRADIVEGEIVEHL